MATSKPTTAPAQDPSAGGSYLRNEDGSLTVTQQTQQPAGRRQSAAPLAPVTETTKDQE